MEADNAAAFLLVNAHALRFLLNIINKLNICKLGTIFLWYNTSCVLLHMVVTVCCRTSLYVNALSQVKSQLKTEGYLCLLEEKKTNGSPLVCPLSVGDLCYLRIWTVLFY
jgi:hypothetical protein